MSCASSLVSHDALGSGDDCGAQALHDLGHIFAVGVNAQTRLGNALQAVDDRSTIFLILEGQGDNTLLAVVGGQTRTHCRQSDVDTSQIQGIIIYQIDVNKE